MEIDYSAYEPVIGLEIHMQLLTKSKAYSSDSTEFGGIPNSNVSVISLGHPGTLPMPNKQVYDFAVRMGLACQCDLTRYNAYARKNYFYTDLPKGYQITQDTTPICRNGFIMIKNDDGTEKRIGLTRIHMEEDSGKSNHDQDPFCTLIDLNRAGVALLEVVSEPEIRSGDEAYKYISEVRKLVRYLDICDGNMEESSLRCDVNISVRKKGTEKFGTRVEVKNINSMSNAKRAIEFEFKQQIEIIENGGKIIQETKSFDASRGETFVLRHKEEANDYRYFPEPDLPPVILTEEYIDTVKAAMPALPSQLYKKYTETFGLSDYDANVIIENKDIAFYFEEIIKHTTNYKAAANWLMGAVKSHLNEYAITIKQFKLPAVRIAEIIALLDEGKLSSTVASLNVFPEMVKNVNESPLAIAQRLNLIQVSDDQEILNYVKQAIAAFPDKVAEYKAGKKGLAGLFMGEVMKLSGGKADPKLANQLVRKMLEE